MARKIAKLPTGELKMKKVSVGTFRREAKRSQKLAAAVAWFNSHS